MLSADEHPGILTFLVGIIILVMAGVGLSLMVDRRLKFSSSVGEIQRSISLDAMELEGLKAWHDERSRLLNDTGSRQQTGAMTNEEAVRKLENLNQRQTYLEETRRQLRKTMTSLEGDFSHCRAEYRRKTWAAALGESLGHLKIRGGREYLQATITRVTDVGLEIRHADGIARIQAPDLDQKLQDRFQWSDEERRKVLQEEHANLEGNAAEPAALADKTPEVVVREVSNFSNNNADANGEELPALRQQVIGWQAKVRQLRSDQMEAASRADSGNSPSVPGGLETWTVRAARLRNALIRGQGELAVAKSRLAAVAPNDSLLRSATGDP